MEIESKELQEFMNCVQTCRDQLFVMGKQIDNMLNTLDLLEKKISSSTQKNRYPFQAVEFNEQNDIPARQTFSSGQNLSSPRRGNVFDLGRPSNQGTEAQSIQRISTNNQRDQQAPSSNDSGLVANFNRLADKKAGYELNQARKEFVSKYNVRAFSCANYEERMNEPIPPPKFLDSESAFSGEYWAVPLKLTQFAVFPNVKAYTNNFHAARAMGEVFNSNFTSGRTYNEIIVDSPAIFEYSGAAWHLKKQGVLQLR